MWNQNRKRIFDKPKIEYVCRALYSVIKSIEYLNKNNSELKVNLKVIDDNSTNENLNKIQKLLKNSKINSEIIKHELSIHENIIKKQDKRETFSNLSTLLRAFEIGKDQGEDLIYFLEDDYIHFESALDEMVSSYERISSQLNERIIYLSC